MGEALSPPARLAFETSHLTHLYAKDRPIHLIRIVLDAFRQRLISSRSVLGILFRSLFGQTAHKAVRDVVNGFRLGRETLFGRN